MWPSCTTLVLVALLRLNPLPAEDVYGRVVDAATREPIAGAYVIVSPRPDRPVVRAYTLRTDEEGRFRSPHLPEGGPANLEVSHPEYVDLTLSGVEVPARAPLEIEMPAGAVLSGRVVSPRGEPVAAASVKLSGALGGGSVDTETTAEGSFEFRGLNPGELRIAVRAPGFIEQRQELTLAEAEMRDGFEVELDDGVRVQGRVLDERGRPAAGCDIELTRQVEDLVILSGRRVARSRSDGRFSFDAGVEPGPVEVSARHRDFGAGWAETELARGDNEVEVYLSREQRVAGRLVDRFGEPVRSAIVSLEPGHVRGLRMEIRRPRAVANPDGSFVIYPRDPGPFELRITSRYYLSPSITVEPPVEDLVVTLDPAANLVGHVVGAEPDELERMEVSARAAQGRAGRRLKGQVGPRGRYSVPGVAPGTWEVRLTVAGSNRRAQEMVDVHAGELEVVRDLVLDDKRLTLTGQVLEEGAPFERAEMEVSSATLDSPIRVTVDDMGRFAFDGLESGLYTLSVDVPGGRYRQPVELRSDQDLSIDLRFFAVAGRVSSEGGGPIAGAWVHVVPDGGQRLRTQTDQYGEFNFPRVLQGKLDLWVAKNGYQTESLDFVVDVSDVHFAAIPLSPATTPNR